MENNRKKYNIAMLAMTLIYVALVAVFIMVHTLSPMVLDGILSEQSLLLYFPYLSL